MVFGRKPYGEGMSQERIVKVKLQYNHYRNKLF